MADLWKHLLSASQSAEGISQALIESKSREIQRERVRFATGLKKVIVLLAFGADESHFSRRFSNPSFNLYQEYQARLQEGVARSNRTRW